MKHTIDDRALRILLLIKIDATNLFDRIDQRMEECIRILALKRNREHFAEIFKSRYDDVSIEDMSLCAEESLIAISNFYTKVEQLKWYLNYTEDMSNQIHDRMLQEIKVLRKLYDTLCLFIDAERTIEEGLDEISAAD